MAFKVNRNVHNSTTIVINHEEFRCSLLQDLAFGMAETQTAMKIWKEGALIREFKMCSFERGYSFEEGRSLEEMWYS